MSNKPSLETCDLDTHEIEYLLCHVGLLWRRLLNAKIKCLGISGTEKRVLFTIARNPGLTQAQIAHLLDLEPQNLLRSIDKLAAQDWLTRKTDEQDRRIKCLHITPAGKKMISKIKALSNNIKPEILQGLKPEDIAQLENKLAKMRENILIQLLREETT